MFVQFVQYIDRSSYEVQVSARSEGLNTKSIYRLYVFQITRECCGFLFRETKNYKCQAKGSTFHFQVEMEAFIRL